MAATMFAVRRSTDVGAPALDGTVGSLIGVLDFVLNVADTTNGWEKVYTGTNKAVYRPRFGNRFYLRVDDGLATPQYAEVRMYESMSDVDTGVDPFPTVAQIALGASWWVKSSSADATARAWKAVVTSRYVMLSMFCNGVQYQVEIAGDAPSEVPSDSYNTLVTYRPSVSYVGYNYCLIGGSAAGMYNNLHEFGAATNTSVPVARWARTPNGVTKSPLAYAHIPWAQATTGFRAYPDAHGKLIRRRIGLCFQEGSNTIYRAYLPHLWWIPYTSGFAAGDTLGDSAYSASATFEVVPIAYLYWLLETSDTGGMP